MAYAQSIQQKTDFDDIPKAKWWCDGYYFMKWKGFWLMPDFLKAGIAVEIKFNPRPSDIIIASFPKSGTTWLKALTVSILGHSSRTETKVDPLITHNPHELVPFLEGETFVGENLKLDIENFPSPRVFNTHFPYSVLPENIKNSRCRIVYICRNPADALVSLWQFYRKNFGVTISVEEAFDDFCGGFVPTGPFFDHVLGYWREKEKENVFFITYEKLMETPHEHVKRLSEFLNCTLSPDQIEEVVRACSFETLTKLDVNRDDESRVHWSGMRFSSFFRKGIVGDAKNYLKPEMVERLNKMARESGLEFLQI